jgi:hypothetical protein
MHDKNIFAWFKELEEKLGQYKYNHNFCRDVIKEWPYISFESKKDWTLMKQGQNPVWSAEVRSIIKEICPPEDFIVVAYGPQLVIGFQDVTTAVAVSMQISKNSDSYMVTYGW